MHSLYTANFCSSPISTNLTIILTSPLFGLTWEYFLKILLYHHNCLINMGTCDLCNRTEDGLSLREAKHKELGTKWVCVDCWTDLYQKNRMISGTTGGGSSFCLGQCSTCPHS
jgi:hypothetical protein